MGRPSEFTQKIADAICERLIDGASLRTICDADDMPVRSTVRKWRDKHKEFDAQYTRARQIGLEALADDLLHLADTIAMGRTVEEGPKGTTIRTGDMIERARLKVDTRKWYLSKLAPKIYGDRSTVDVNVNDKTVARLAAGRKRVGG